MMCEVQQPSLEININFIYTPFLDNYDFSAESFLQKYMT